MYRDGSICPKCGKIVKVVMNKEEGRLWRD